MWKAFFADGQLLGFALFSLLFFVAIFVTAVIRASTLSRRRIDDLAALPLLDDAPAARPQRGENHA